MSKKVLAKVGKRGVLTIPASLREKWNIDEGEVVEIEETAEGFVVRPKLLLDKAQAYFWTKEWQEKEREADEDIRAGRIRATKSAEDLIRTLDEESE
jgi:AbrB family looped-hinge helix DNA binding protein